MKKLFVVCFFASIVASLYSQEQEYNDDRFVVSLVEDDGADVQCAVFSDLTLNQQDGDEVAKLIKSGRYIKSITSTKFGFFVVSTQNLENIPQMCAVIPSYALKKELNKRFKEGWSLSYYNKERGYAVFDKNPAVTVQKVMELKMWKSNTKEKIAKLNQKGLYLTFVDFGDVVAQNGHGDNIEQCAAYLTSYNKDDEFVKGVQKYKDDGWVVSSCAKVYNNRGDYDSYDIMFDRPGEKTQEQKILFVREKGGMEEMKVNLDLGYRIDKTWCGWGNRTYTTSGDSYKPDWVGILGGIISGVGQLTGGGSSNVSSNVQSSYGIENTVAETLNSNASNGKGSSNASKKDNSSKANNTNWRRLEQAYDGYETQLIKMSNSSKIDKQEVRQIQRKMKDIREKIRTQSGGHQRAVSQWETWNP